MCILFIAVNKHPKYPLIIAANRDEFHKRPTQQSQFWESAPDVLGGIDMEAGGTWMGVTRHGKLAALTNIRDPNRIKSNAISRGALVADFLKTDVTVSDYSSQISKSVDDYNGYNLLFGDLPSMDIRTFNSHLSEEQRLETGFYGLSNASLDVAWPKIQRGKKALEQYCETHKQLDTQALFSILADPTLAEDTELPKTGVPLEWEKRLSSIFITSEDYGTRASTLLLMDKQMHIYWYENSFDQYGEVTGSRAYDFPLEKS
ncbi:NRDE family protein [Alteromonas facilis]|uniref:NRDE family protein n=1 Tax=Alteromonas facilis TaxID=2048004 RepID=UPI000C286AFB|nr:NRDE family protein [Alteromonas facilis]